MVKKIGDSSANLISHLGFGLGHGPVLLLSLSFDRTPTISDLSTKLHKLHWSLTDLTLIALLFMTLDLNGLNNRNNSSTHNCPLFCLLPAPGNPLQKSLISTLIPFLPLRHPLLVSGHYTVITNPHPSTLHPFRTRQPTTSHIYDNLLLVTSTQ